MTMEMRPVSATILSATGAPREGLRVDFHATPPDVSVNAVTDAGGVFVAALVPGVAYMVPVMNAVMVEGQDFPAGTVFRVVVPGGEGPATLAEVAVEIIDASTPALLARLAALESRLTALEVLP
ncbi:MAG: hypothetical protein M3Q75_13835 [Gemmatimonadota bacterium]|nr:hypothetical protein [Gemmatimonadota bacterium]